MQKALFALTITSSLLTWSAPMVYASEQKPLPPHINTADSSKDLPADFHYQTYLALNPDLQKEVDKKGLNPKLFAQNHYLTQGKKAGRPYTAPSQILSTDIIKEDQEIDNYSTLIDHVFKTKGTHKRQSHFEEKEELSGYKSSLEKAKTLISKRLNDPGLSTERRNKLLEIDAKVSKAEQMLSQHLSDKKDKTIDGYSDLIDHILTTKGAPKAYTPAQEENEVKFYTSTLARLKTLIRKRLNDPDLSTERRNKLVEMEGKASEAEQILSQYISSFAIRDKNLNKHHIKVNDKLKANRTKMGAKTDPKPRKGPEAGTTGSLK